MRHRCPEAVSVGGDDPKEKSWGVDYSKLTPLLVKSLQEQQGQIDELRALIVNTPSTSSPSASSIEDLAGQVADLSARVDALSIDTLDSLAITGGLEIAGEVDLGPDTVGEAVIKAGDTSVEIPFTNPYQKQPIVSATVSEFITGQYRVTNKTVNGFTIELSEAQVFDVTLDWHAFGSSGGVRLFSDGLTETIQPVD